MQNLNHAINRAKIKIMALNVLFHFIQFQQLEFLTIKI